MKNQCKGKFLKLSLLAYLIVFFQFVKFWFIFMLWEGLLEAWLEVWLFKVVLLLCNVDVLAKVEETLIQELEKKVSNPWCHGCFWDYASLVLAIGKL